MQALQELAGAVVACGLTGLDHMFSVNWGQDVQIAPDTCGAQNSVFLFVVAHIIARCNNSSVC